STLLINQTDVASVNDHCCSRRASLDPQFIKISTFCKTYETGRTKTYELIKSGKIRAVKSGRATLLEVASAQKHFSNLPKFKSKAKSGNVSGDSNCAALSDSSEAIENAAK